MVLKESYHLMGAACRHKSEILLFDDHTITLKISVEDRDGMFDKWSGVVNGSANRHFGAQMRRLLAINQQRKYE